MNGRGGTSSTDVVNAGAAYEAAVAKLSTEQRAVVSEVYQGIQRKERRPLRVLAAAGSGKTATLVTTCATLVRSPELKVDAKDRGFPGHEIVLTSFTRVARREMQERLDKIAPNSGVNIRTFHGLAFVRVGAAFKARNPIVMRPHGWNSAANLDSAAGKRRAEVAEKGNEPTQWKRLAFLELDELWERIWSKGEIPGLPEGTPPVRDRFKAESEGQKLEDTLSAIEIWRAYGANTPAEATHVSPKLSPPAQFQTYAWNLYNKAKANLGAWDFYDILLAFRDLVVAGQSSARLVIVDEAQDNSPVQMLIARKLAENHPQGRVVYIGDIRQSIYSFQGADPSILGDADKTEGAMTLELSTNYRSGTSIVQAGNAAVEGEEWSVGAPAVAARPTPGKVEFLGGGLGVADRAKQVAADIADQISRGATAADFSILSRTRAACNIFEIFLHLRGIPADMRSGGSFFKDKVVRRFMAILRLAGGFGDDAVLAADFNGSLRAFVPGKFSKQSVMDVWSGVDPKGPNAAKSGWWKSGVRPTHVYQDLTEFMNAELDRERGRILLWSTDDDEREARVEGFEWFMSALRTVVEGAPAIKAGAKNDKGEPITAGSLIWDLARIFHNRGIIEIPDFDVAEEEQETKPDSAVAQGSAPPAAQVAVGPNKSALVSDADSAREVVAAIADIADAIGLKVLAELSVRGTLADVRGEHAKASPGDMEDARATDANRVAIGTVHSAKGSEWPQVFLLAGKGELPIDNPNVDLAEELRIFYVGVTRARDRLILAAAGEWSKFVDRVRPDNDKAKAAAKDVEREVEAAVAEEHEPLATVPELGDPNVSVPAPPSPEEQADPADAEVAEYMALRRVVEQTRPDLVALYDRLQTDVIRTMAQVRQELSQAAEPPQASSPERRAVHPGDVFESLETDYAWKVGETGAEIELDSRIFTAVVQGDDIVIGLGWEDLGRVRWNDGSSAEAIANAVDLVARNAKLPPPSRPSIEVVHVGAQRPRSRTDRHSHASGGAVDVGDVLRDHDGSLRYVTQAPPGTRGGTVPYVYDQTFTHEPVDTQTSAAYEESARRSGKPIRTLPIGQSDTGAFASSEIATSLTAEEGGDHADVQAPQPDDLVEWTPNGKCYLQLRVDGRAYGGPFSNLIATPVSLLPGTPIACTRDRGYSVGIIESDGYVERKFWPDTREALAQMGPLLDELTGIAVAHAPPALRDSVDGLSIWYFSAGRPFSRTEGSPDFRGVNLIPGGQADKINNLVTAGFLAAARRTEGKKLVITDYEWTIPD